MLDDTSTSNSSSDDDSTGEADVSALTEVVLSSSSMNLPKNIAKTWQDDLSASVDEFQNICKPKRNIKTFDKLLKAVCLSLTEATTMPYGKQRSVKILFLFESLLYPIEPECLIKLYGTCEGKVTRRYYQTVAKRFEEIQPEEAFEELKVVHTNLESFFPTLRSNPNFPQLFALLFHRWLFCENFEHNSLTKQMGLFLKGVNRLFWMDLETGRSYFKPIFIFLEKRVLLNNSLWDVENHFFKHMDSIFRVFSKFFFYYRQLDDLSLFLTKIQSNILAVKAQIKLLHEVDLSSEHSITNMFTALDDSQSQLQISLTTYPLLSTPVIDIFLAVVVRTCNNIRNETILVNYLESFRVFAYARFTGRSDALLFTTLQTFSNPGGPLYPPKSVRIAATETLGDCFPQGKWIRTGIKYGFRLLHPIHVLSAVIARVVAILLFLKTILLLLLNPFTIPRAIKYFRSRKQKGPELPTQVQVSRKTT